MSPLQVIGLGCGRTGTESLRFALNKLGYTTHHGYCFIQDRTLDPGGFTQAALDPSSADWDKLYEKFDAAVDWPTANFSRELYHRYPDAKFILTIRDADSWYRSFKNTLYKVAVERGEMKPEHPLYSFMVMSNIVIFNGALQDLSKFKDEEYAKDLFNKHNEEVKKTIPAEQLYIMELGSGWDGLCKFLGKEVPSEPYPTSNSTSEFQKKSNVLKDEIAAVCNKKIIA